MDKLHLGVFLGGNSNYHTAGWRHEAAFSDAGSNFARWITLARKMEAAKLDMLFIADVPGVSLADNPETLARLTSVLLSAYVEPSMLARFPAARGVLNKKYEESKDC